MAARIEIYRRRSLIPTHRTYGWRLVADNDQVIATDGGQGYSDRDVAVFMAHRVLKTGAYSDVPISEV